MNSRQSVWAVGPRKAFVRVARVLSYLVYFYLIAVEIILFMGFFLLLFGANPSAEFTQWVYRNLDRVMEPFRGIFTPIQLGTTSGNVESVFETSVLFAMIVYGIIALAFSALIPWLTRRVRYLELSEANAEADQLLQPVATAQPSRMQPIVTTQTDTEPGASAQPPPS